MLMFSSPPFCHPPDFYAGVNVGWQLRDLLKMADLVNVVLYCQSRLCDADTDGSELQVGSRCHRIHRASGWGIGNKKPAINGPTAASYKPTQSCKVHPEQTSSLNSGPASCEGTVLNTVGISKCWSDASLCCFFWCFFLDSFTTNTYM